MRAWCERMLAAADADVLAELRIEGERVADVRPPSLAAAMEAALPRVRVARARVPVAQELALSRAHRRCTVIVDVVRTFDRPVRSAAGSRPAAAAAARPRRLHVRRRAAARTASSWRRASRRRRRRPSPLPVNVHAVDAASVTSTSAVRRPGGACRRSRRARRTAAATVAGCRQYAPRRRRCRSCGRAGRRDAARATPAGARVRVRPRRAAARRRRVRRLRPHAPRLRPVADALRVRLDCPLASGGAPRPRDDEGRLLRQVEYVDGGGGVRRLPLRAGAPSTASSRACWRPERPAAGAGSTTPSTWAACVQLS